MSICKAISDKTVIEFYYDGAHRVVEPHCHGWSMKGKEVIRGYQRRGSSAKSHKLGWKLFAIEEMSELVLTDELFSVRPDYKRNDRGMTSIHCQI